MSSKNNAIADSLSRMQWTRFKHLVKKRGKKMERLSTVVPDKIWPMSKIWVK